MLFRSRVTVSDAENPRVDTTIPENIRQVLARADAERSAEDQAALRTYYRTQVAAASRAWVAEIAKLKQDQAAIERTIPTAMVMQEMEKPRDAFVLTRGQYDKPGERVSAGVPAFLPPLPEGAPANRLGLAKWLVAPNHPLMARVTVNRLWQSVFGVGIVKTAEDFGSQGELPMHPELLDWLASEFIALVQILVYGGGVAILLLFGLMMTNASDDPIVQDGSQKPFGFGVALVLGIVLVSAMSGAVWGGSLETVAGFREIGTRLYRDYGVPFEVASLVLLVALIGAVTVARRDREEDAE